jgi:hypothetical protein
MFKKYQHIERLGTNETDGLLLGQCYVFPKIDGTNGSVWLDDDGVQFGSRRRHLVGGEDNAGFKEAVDDVLNWPLFFQEHPSLRLFGEWLIPHSLKTYREDAWRKFYVFDVVEDLPDVEERGQKFKYLPYEEYQLILEEYSIDYIAPIKIIKNPTYEQLIGQLEQNIFLIEGGKGCGEGIVIKNYDFVNCYGRTTWGKIVTSEFKEKHSKVMGAPSINGRKMVEEDIVAEFCTTALIEKTQAKIVAECDGWNSKFIPRLLQTVFYDLIKEDCWSFVKKFKNPKIDFKTLNTLCITKIKEAKPELF